MSKALEIAEIGNSLSVDGNGNLVFEAGVGITADVTGNADTATTLETARTINSVSFDGSANITVADSTKVAKAGDTMTGNLSFGDNNKAIFGAELEIYSDATHARIREYGGGQLKIQGDNMQLLTSAGTATYLEGNASTGAVTLYHAANAPRISTTATGIDVTGTVTADGLSVVGGPVGYVGEITNISGAAGSRDGLKVETLLSNSTTKILTAASNSIDRFVVTGEGNVGIGTGSPGTKLSNLSTRIGNADGLTTNTSGIEWALSGQGYIASLSNTSTAAPGNYNAGLLVELASTDATDKILDLESGGVNRVRVLGNGNVGIGASPIAKLSVVGGTSNASNLATAYSLATFNITPKSTSGYSLQFGSGPSDLPYIQMSAGGTASGNLLIQPYGGNVGIGTTSPNQKFEVVGGRSFFSANSENFAIGFRYSPSHATMYIGGTNSVSAPSIQFSNAGGGPLVNITYDGNVGIGTTTPVYKIDGGFANQTWGWYLNTSYNSGFTYNTTERSLLIHTKSSENIDHIKFATGGAATERMRISSTGDVGIGTTATALFNSVGGSTKLAVTGSSASTDVLGNTDASISIINTDTTANNTAGLHFARADTDDNPNYAGASIVTQFHDTQSTGQYPKASMNFLTSTVANAAPSLKMTIDSSGNVGIGTSSIDTKLVIVETPATIVSGNAISGSTMKGLKIRTNANGDESVGVWFGTNGSHWSGISGQRKNAAGTWGTNLSFYTHEDATTDLTYTRERMTIDSAGNVGIGTTTPSAKLDVAGPASITSFTGTTELGIVVQGSTGATDYSGIDFKGYSQVNPVARIGVITTGGGSKLSFGTSNSYVSGITNTAMTIDSSGNVGIGTSSPSSYGKLAVYNVTGDIEVACVTGSANYATYRLQNSSRRYSMQIRTDQANAWVLRDESAASNRFIMGTNGYFGFAVGAPTYMIHLNGGTAGPSNSGIAAAWSVHSDYRLKENVATITTATEAVSRLRPVTFSWIEENEPEATTAGFIAHEMAEVAPYSVMGEKDAVNEDGSIRSQGADYSKLVPLLTAALQEALTEITALKARVTALEA
jgi:hypothetical protein